MKKQVILNKRKPLVNKINNLLMAVAVIVVIISLLIFKILPYVSGVLSLLAIILIVFTMIFFKSNNKGIYIFEKYEYSKNINGIYLFKIDNWYESEDKEFDIYVKEETSSEEVEQKKWKFVEQNRNKLNSESDTNKDNEKKRNLLSRRKQIQQNNTVDPSGTE